VIIRRFGQSGSLRIQKVPFDLRGTKGAATILGKTSRPWSYQQEGVQGCGSQIHMLAGHPTETLKNEQFGKILLSQSPSRRKSRIPNTGASHHSPQVSEQAPSAWNPAAGPLPCPADLIEWTLDKSALTFARVRRLVAGRNRRRFLLIAARTNGLVLRRATQS